MVKKNKTKEIEIPYEPHKGQKPFHESKAKFRGIKTEHIITFKNNARVIYLNGDNERNIDRLRGLKLGSAYGDELTYCNIEFTKKKMEDENENKSKSR